jgi:hypothetical protein
VEILKSAGTASTADLDFTGSSSASQTVATTNDNLILLLVNAHFLQTTAISDKDRPHSLAFG